VKFQYSLQGSSGKRKDAFAEGKFEDKLVLIGTCDKEELLKLSIWY